MTKNLPILVCIGLISLSAFASTGQRKLTFYGTVRSYDKSTVTLMTENKTALKVPRDSVFPKVDQSLPSNVTVAARISIAEFIELNPKIKALYEKFAAQEAKKSARKPAAKGAKD